MKRSFQTILALIAYSLLPLTGQEDKAMLNIDLMLIHGEFNRAVDTCLIILKTDSLNHKIWYRLGQGYQNLPPDEKSFDCFLKASVLDPGNSLYKFMVGKSFYEKNRNTKAKPLFLELCKADSMNWSYAYYLTSILMAQRNYDDAIKIYKRFYERDSVNYIILDRLGFAYLRKKEYRTSIDFFERSLDKHGENLNVIKNLSYLYPFVNKTNKAVEILTQGIEIDSMDMDLYVRRANIYFAQRIPDFYLKDYLNILASGDSSFLYLKRAGIGFAHSNMWKDATFMLEKAYKLDSSDYDVLDYLGLSFSRLKEHKKSLYYYLRKEAQITALSWELYQTYISIGYEYLAEKNYSEAVNYFLLSLEKGRNENLLMAVANIYDEKLNNVPKAIRYYRQFLSEARKQGTSMTDEYVGKVRKRLEYLEKTQKQPPK